MSILKVARMGHPVLRQKARAIEKHELRRPGLQQFIDDMIETMKEYSGVGLAAPQVHESVRIFVAHLDPDGRGDGYVPSVWSWAQQAGRAVRAGEGTPNPGDLIVWSGHIGLVEAVLPGGRVQTIEGNSSDRVTRRVHDASSPLGYVRMS